MPPLVSRQLDHFHCGHKKIDRPNAHLNLPSGIVDRSTHPLSNRLSTVCVRRAVLQGGCKIHAALHMTIWVSVVGATRESVVVSLEVKRWDVTPSAFGLVFKR